MNSSHRSPNNGSNIILVIDDDPAIISVFRKMLELEYTILTAPNAEQGYPLLQNNDVGVLICNEDLSGEHGLEFMARITDEFKYLQTVLMSEGVSEDLLSFAINDVGVLKYLKKPLVEDEVKKAVISSYSHYLKAVEIDTITHDYLNILQEIKSLPYIIRRIQQATPILISHLWTTVLTASGTITMVFTIFFILGITVLIVLYILKSFLGIDVFVEKHFLDFLSRAHRLLYHHTLIG
jgi:response regulator RpfG family c-di-GMP phosphodiesterase